MHVTLVHVHVKPADIEAFIAASRANHEASVREPRNRRFDVLQNPKDAGHFILYQAILGRGGLRPQADGALRPGGYRGGHDGRATPGRTHDWTFPKRLK